jgi:hypothetical protein
MKTVRELLTMQYGKDDKMIEHCAKSHCYLQINGLTVSVCEAKPSITKTIWYDDEGTDPGSDYKSFLFANRYHEPRLWENDHMGGRLAFCVQYWQDKTGGELVNLQYVGGDCRTPAAFVRFVTDSELRQINEVVKTAAADYRKRLEAYYKKYADKVRSRGYWANR